MTATRDDRSTCPADRLAALRVDAWIRIVKPIGYSDEAFAGWQQITWLPDRTTWNDRPASGITVGLGGNTGRLRLDWPLDRIEIAKVQP